MSDCPHHWLIDSPNGSTSTGVCKLCGAVKQFRNSDTDVRDAELAARDFGFIPHADDYRARTRQIRKRRWAQGIGQDVARRRS